ERPSTARAGPAPTAGHTAAGEPRLGQTGPPPSPLARRLGHDRCPHPLRPPAAAPPPRRRPAPPSADPRRAHRPPHRPHAGRPLPPPRRAALATPRLTRPYRAYQPGRPGHATPARHHAGPGRPRPARTAYGRPHPAAGRARHLAHQCLRLRLVV